MTVSAEYLAVEFAPGTAKYKILEAMAAGGYAHCKLKTFNNPIARDQYVNANVRLRFAIDQDQAVRLGVY